MPVAALKACSGSIGDVHGRSRDYHEELSLGKRVLCCCEGEPGSGEGLLGLGLCCSSVYGYDAFTAYCMLRVWSFGKSCRPPYVHDS